MRWARLFRRGNLVGRRGLVTRAGAGGMVDLPVRGRDNVVWTASAFRDPRLTRFLIPDAASFRQILSQNAET